MLREKGRGRVFWYFRRGKGKRTRLPGEYGSPEFMRAYQAALSDGPPPKVDKRDVGTLKWFVDEYFKSTEFKSMKPSTQKVKANILRAICDNAGHHQLEEIDAKAIRAGRDARAHTPNAANNFLKTMSALFKWGVEMQHVETNPCRDVTRVKVKTEGHHVWTVEEIEQYQATWGTGTRERLALDLLMYTGLRRGDVVRIGPKDVINGVLTLVTEKYEVQVSIPILPALQESIDATATGETFIISAQGKPMTKESFGNWFRKCCAAAKVPGRAHGMRKAAATLAAENGATDSELKAIFGWTTDEMPTLYTRKANRKKLAQNATKFLSRP
ncbi:tyrosine-type recombinase/integrase [Pseudovibrio exalbescens]|uniref:tyrosine-type recombinase/integrase n=1 Tax=Pseudovibrio exalbescens TaxID=197461 RepID=UPI001AD928F3|nr:site-specific integrase [Pseudovibrio exalbescens]